MLKVRIGPDRDVEEDARRAVANFIARQNNGLPLIPLAEKAHVQAHCYDCNSLFWAPVESYQQYCDDCRLRRMEELQQRRQRVAAKAQKPVKESFH